MLISLQVSSENPSKQETDDSDDGSGQSTSKLLQGKKKAKLSSRRKETRRRAEEKRETLRNDEDEDEEASKPHPTPVPPSPQLYEYELSDDSDAQSSEDEGASETSRGGARGFSEPRGGEPEVLYADSPGTSPRESNRQATLPSPGETSGHGAHGPSETRKQGSVESNATPSSQRTTERPTKGKQKSQKILLTEIEKLLEEEDSKSTFLSNTYLRSSLGLVHHTVE